MSKQVNTPTEETKFFRFTLPDGRVCIIQQSFIRKILDLPSGGARLYLRWFTGGEDTMQNALESASDIWAGRLIAGTRAKEVTQYMADHPGADMGDAFLAIQPKERV